MYITQNKHKRGGSSQSHTIQAVVPHDIPACQSVTFLFTSWPVPNPWPGGAVGRSDTSWWDVHSIIKSDIMIQPRMQRDAMTSWLSHTQTSMIFTTSVLMFQISQQVFWVYSSEIYTHTQYSQWYIPIRALSTWSSWTHPGEVGGVCIGIFSCHWLWFQCLCCCVYVCCGGVVVGFQGLINQTSGWISRLSLAQLACLLFCKCWSTALH